MSELTKNSIETEEWREYDIPGRSTPYRIVAPKVLFMRPGGTTHRVVDSNDVVHCVPAPGTNGTVLRWQNKDRTVPVDF